MSYGLLVAFSARRRQQQPAPNNGAADMEQSIGQNSDEPASGQRDEGSGGCTPPTQSHQSAPVTAQESGTTSEGTGCSPGRQPPAFGVQQPGDGKRPGKLW